jgi:hypothetical protein
VLTRSRVRSGRAAHGGLLDPPPPVKVRIRTDVGGSSDSSGETLH